MIWWQTDGGWQTLIHCWFLCNTFNFLFRPVDLNTGICCTWCRHWVALWNIGFGCVFFCGGAFAQNSLFFNLQIFASPAVVRVYSDRETLLSFRWCVFLSALSDDGFLRWTLLWMALENSHLCCCFVLSLWWVVVGRCLVTFSSHHHLFFFRPSNISACSHFEWPYWMGYALFCSLLLQFVYPEQVVLLRRELVTMKTTAVSGMIWFHQVSVASNLL